MTGKVHRVATPGTAPRRVVGPRKYVQYEPRPSALRSTAPDDATRQTFPVTALGAALPSPGTRGGKPLLGERSRRSRRHGSRRRLRNLRLVTGQRHGRSIVYALYDDHAAELLDQALYRVEHLRLGVRDAPAAVPEPAVAD